MNKVAPIISLIFFTLLFNVQAIETTGTTAGEFRVSEQGAATYSIPINLPAGTAGVTPQISLTYSSQGGDGVMGIGWSLSAGGIISRCPRTIAQDGIISGVDLSNNDRFCLNGQRLIHTSGTHGRDGAIYYTEIDSFSKVEAHGNADDNGPLGFTVETKSGEIHHYGYSDDGSGHFAYGDKSFVEPKGKATKSLASVYLLTAIEDVSGNYIYFAYNEVDGTATLKKVSYGGNVKLGQTSYAYAQMNYVTKKAAAKRSGYQAGYASLQDDLLDSIEIRLNDQPIHYYDLDYFVPNLAEENYTLESIQECTDSAKTSCYPATTFDWHKPVLSTQTTQEFCEYEPNAPEFCYSLPTNSNFNPFGNQTGKLTNGYNVGTNQVFDMNGDGYSDIIYTNAGYYKIALGPTFSTIKSLTNIGDNKSQYLLNLDYNGDGKRDLLVANSSASNWTVVSFEKSTATEEICEPEPSVDFCYEETVMLEIKVQSIGRMAIGLEGQAQIMDIDGNGLEDIVYQSGSKIYWYKNNGGSFSVASELLSFANNNSDALFHSPITEYTASMQNASGIDINGDGRSDLIIKVTDTVSNCTANGRIYGAVSSQNECEMDLQGVWSTTTTKGYKLYTSNGSALNAVQDLGDYEDIRVADLNGDGLTDLLHYSASSQWSYRLSDGRSLMTSTTLPYGNSSDTYKNQSYFIDLNGDGAAEFLKATSSTNWNIYVSQYATDETISLTYRGNISRTSGATYQFGDVDGDGKLDLLQGKTDSHGWKVSYAPRSGKPDYLLKQITNGFGVSSEIFYRPMTDNTVYLFSESDANVNSNIFSPMSGMALVSRVESDIRTNSRVAIDYQYGGFLVHRQGRGMLGFEQVRTIDNASLIETATLYQQSFPYIGMPLATRQFLTDGRIISDATNVLSSQTTVNGQTSPYIQSSNEKSWSVGSDNLLYEINQTDSSFTYDIYGNLTNSTVTISDHSGNNELEIKTVNTFGGTWEKQMGRLRTSTVTKTRDSVSKSRRTNFSYYSRYDPTTPGLLKTSEIWPDSATQSLLTSFEYDNFGNKSKVTKTGAENADGSNVQNRAAQSFYGSNGRLLDYVIDSAGIITSYLYNGISADSVTGRMTEISTSVNGMTQTNYTDDWGRIIRSSVPGGSDVNTYYDYCDEVACDITGAYFRMRTTQSGSPEKRVFYDTFGRETATKIKNFLGGWNIVRREYDSQGRESKVYEPTTGTSTYYSQPTYDSYGRTTRVRRPDSTYVYHYYYGLKTKLKNARGYVRYSWQNEQGELDKTQDAKGNVLKYSYDPYGNLLNVKMTASNLETTTKVINIFDDYGRKTQTNDTDKGSWQYQCSRPNCYRKISQIIHRMIWPFYDGFATLQL